MKVDLAEGVDVGFIIYLSVLIFVLLHYLNWGFGELNIIRVNLLYICGEGMV